MENQQIKRAYSHFSNPNTFAKFVEKVIAKYESDEYYERWYSRGIEPPKDLYWFLYYYVKKWGRECSESEWDVYGNIFTGELYYYNNYYFQIMHGQGSIIKILKEENQNHTNPNNELIDGRLPIFRVKMDRQKFGLSEEGAMLQDMAEEYAVVADEKANAGLIVYGKYNGIWRVNPWSTRFLIRILLENSGVSLPPFN